MRILVRTMKKSGKSAVCRVCDECDHRSRFVAIPEKHFEKSKSYTERLPKLPGWSDSVKSTGRNKWTHCDYCPKCSKKRKAKP